MNNADETQLHHSRSTPGSKMGVPVQDLSEVAPVLKSVKEHLTSARSRVLRSRWLERIARLGYTSKGLVYIVVGVLAVQAAFSARGQTTGVRGALKTIVEQPLGWVGLGVITLGLAFYVIWRLVGAVVDPANAGSHMKGILRRIGYAGSGLIFGRLTWEAGEIIVGWGRGDVNVAEDWTRVVLAQPLGRWLVAIAGLIAIGIGLYHFYESFTARFRRKFKLNEMGDIETRWVTHIGRFGLAARGILFGIVGGFLIVAALRSDAEQARGLGEALEGLSGQPFGPWLLAFVALGLIAYGLYMLAEARYRWIVAPRSDH